jgi:hypothetical protein
MLGGDECHRLVPQLTQGSVTVLDFEPSKSWTSMLEKLEQTTNPRHRRMLSQVIAHARGEVDGDLDGVMATLSPNPVYRYVRPTGLDDDPRGTDEVRDFYLTDIFGGGRHILEGDKDRVVVDDDTVITEGTIKVLQWGRDLVDRGAQVDPDATYLMSMRYLIVWPFDDEQRIIGEESWHQAHTRTLVKVADEDVPQRFRDYIAAKLAGAQA